MWTNKGKIIQMKGENIIIAEITINQQIIFKRELIRKGDCFTDHENSA
jgi:hypothetical protein